MLLVANVIQIILVLNLFCNPFLIRHEIGILKHFLNELLVVIYGVPI